MDVRLRLEHTLIAIEREQRLNVMMELTGPEPAATGERPPLSVALVLDRSGSMAGAKLAAAAACAGWLGNRLGARQRLALVAFDHEVVVAHPLAPVRGERVSAVLRWLGPGGATNLSGGWLKGVELLREADGAGPRRLLLLTDGAANQGITDVGQLVELARWAAEQGVSTTTVGYGEDFHEDLLQRMADAGGGRAHYAASPDAAPAVFADEAADLAALVAQNVSVEIRPAEPVRFLEVLGDQPVSPTARGVRLELGDAYAGQSRRVVFALDVPRLAELGPRAVGEVLVRYTTLGAEPAAHRLTLPVTANLAPAAEAAQAGTDQEVREEIEILRAAREQREAADDADRGDFQVAKARLQGAARRLRKLGADSKRIEELLAHAADLDASADLVRPETWGPGGAKSLSYRSHGMARGQTPQQKRPRRTDEDEERKST